MTTRRKPTITINDHHDALLGHRRAAREAVKGAADGNVPDEGGEDLDARLFTIRMMVRASRKLRTKLGAEAKLPNAECDGRKAETIEQFEAVRVAMVEAAKG